MTPARFRTGMTFDEYVHYVGTPENLRREAGWWLGPQRLDFRSVLRARYEARELTGAQIGAIRWLASQRNGPAHALVIAEDWSSDCRRDVPALARLAEAGGLELRIFTRDGDKAGRGPTADPAESPNADIMAEAAATRPRGRVSSPTGPPCRARPSSQSGRARRSTRSSPRSTSVALPGSERRDRRQRVSCCARSRSEARLCAGAKWSTSGSAAAMPRVSGS